MTNLYLDDALKEIAHVTTPPSLLDRLIADGVDDFSTADLLLLVTETERAEPPLTGLLQWYADLASLAQASVHDLERVLPRAAAARLVAAFELGRRLARERTPEPAVVQTADDAAALLADMAHLPQEHVRVVLLDIRRRVIAMPTIYIGTLTASVLRPAEIFRAAITRGSAMILLAHNHPSGDPTPSPEDVETTRALGAAGRLLDIPLVDHLIIGRGKWVSLRDMGFTF